jgi:hypothetical protein
MELTCYRDAELQREPRRLPAALYNIAHLLLERSTDGVVFVPIRSMQFLAVIDREEIIFLDAEQKSQVDIAWQHFRPQLRASLTDPVPYEAVHYCKNAEKTMNRLLVEFAPALNALSAKNAPSGVARIIKLDRG